MATRRGLSVGGLLSGLHARVAGSPLAYYGLAILVLVALLYTGYYLRMLPLDNYRLAEQLAIKHGLHSDVARYAYITANDPWIEYWLAQYLHDHGIGSWKTLTPENPATRIFWYPWGRDFPRSEYPLIPILGSMGSDPLMHTMKLPVYGGLAMIAVAFTLLLLDYGLLAATLGGLLLAVLPAAASRTYFGFVEKEGFSMFMLVASLLILSKALERRSQGLGVAAGVAAGLIALSWGGYAVAGLAIAATALFAPLAARDEDDRARVLRVLVAAAAAYLATCLVLDATGYGRAAPSYAAIPLVAAVYTYAAVYAMEGVEPIRRLLRVESWGFQRSYGVVLVATLVVGVVAAPLLGIRGKYLASMLWPLKSAGLIHVGRLGETVAEMASVFSSPGIMRSFLSQTGYTVTLLIPLLSLYLLYRAISRREPRHLPVALTALGLFYGALGMVYLSQSASTIGAVAVAVASSVFLGETQRLLEEAEEAGRGRRRRGRRGVSSEILQLRLLAAGLLVFLVVVGAAVGFAQNKRTLGATMSTIAGLGKNLITLGWLGLLDKLKYNIPQDVPVVAWWDYGYWISVGSGHPSLADGATINSTQIRLLAEAFTGTEEEASKIYERLHLQPNNTLILVHDLALYDAANKALYYMYTLSTDDIKKAWAMHHIAERDENYQRFLNTLCRTGNQQQLREIVANTFIFKLFIDAPLHSENIVVIPGNTPLKIDIKRVGIACTPQSRIISLGKQEFKHFKPYMVVVAPYYNSRGQLVSFGPNLYPVRVIVLYKWTG